MQPFQYKNKIINFSSYTGIVAGSLKSSETHVSSVGGGGYIKDGTGYVSAPSIRSTVINKHEFWIIGEDGKETAINAGGADIPLRDGQNVTVIAGFPQNGERGWYLLLYNYNAQRYWFILSNANFVDYFKLCGRWGYQLFIALFVILPAVYLVAFFADIVFGGNNGNPTLVIILILLGIALAIFYCISTYKSVKARRERIADLFRHHLDTLIGEIVNKV